MWIMRSGIILPPYLASRLNDGNYHPPTTYLYLIRGFPKTLFSDPNPSYSTDPLDHHDYTTKVAVSDYVEYHSETPLTLKLDRKEAGDELIYPRNLLARDQYGLTLAYFLEQNLPWNSPSHHVTNTFTT